MRNPGWIELQTNGALGIDFSDPELTEEQFLKVADWLLEMGSTVFLPTLITHPLADYRRNASVIRKAVQKRGLEKQIPGLHLEGPMLCPQEGAIGAHQSKWVQPPSAKLVRELQEMTDGFIRMLTVAANEPGAPEAIAEARKLRIIPSVGHHLATNEDLARAVEAGALTLTHLGNGCPNLIHRHHNTVLSGLAEDRLSAMIITDGSHLPPELIKVMVRTKGVDRIIVTSDGCMASGLKPGTYNLMGHDGAVIEPSGKFWYPPKGFLIGSTLTIAQCMDYLESLHLLTEEQLVQVGRDNPLRLLQEICGYSL